MSIQILYDPLEGIACLYDSETFQTTGPMARYSDGMHPERRLRAFINWCALCGTAPTPEAWNTYTRKEPTTND